MKKLFVVYILVTVLVAGKEAIAQPYTPKCTNLSSNAYTFSEGTQPWIDASDATATSTYPNATMIDHSSTTYNCHTYAWHTSNGGGHIWLNTPADDSYWTDGSYSQVSNTPDLYPTKVSYASDDHSAITTGTPNVLKSKWGQWPLMQHASTYTPYNSTTLNYYAVPVSSGASLLCTSSTYTTITPGSGSPTYAWTAGSHLLPSSQSGGTNSFNVSATGDGSSYVSLQLTSTCSGTTVTARKNIWVGTQEPVPMVWPAVTKGPLVCHSPDIHQVEPAIAGGTIQWYVGGSWVIIGASTGTHANIRANGDGYASVTITNTCGDNSYYGPEYDPCSMFLMIYPNPTTESLTIMTSKPGSDDQLDLFSEVNVFNDRQEKVFSSQNFEKSLQIDTKPFPKGTYIVQVIHGDNVEERKVIIE